MSHSCMFSGEAIRQIIDSGVKRGGLVGLLLAGSLMIGESPASAQITPDQSLGTESSRVTPGGTLRNGRRVNQRIDGGATRGSNLFHSFNEFNVRSDEQVYFQNPNGIENIFSRVTGSDVSDILGTLGVDGSANLFLLNPNGIVFGANAWLDLRGSFLATTAEGLVFPDGFTFSARNPQTPPLLTVNVPIGLQYGSSPGAIAVNGAALILNPGQRLELSGGDVSIEGSPYLGTLNPLLTGNTDGQPAGNQSGGLFINADTLTMNGSVLSTATLDQTNADGIGIRANSVFVNHGSQISASTSGLGNAGNIQIRASNIVQIGTAASPELLPNAILTSSEPGADGQAGNITIAAPTLRLANGSVLDTSANAGNAGNITIDAAVVEVSRGGQFLTSVSGSGNAGQITVNATDRLTLTGQDPLFDARRLAYPPDLFPGYLRNVGRETALFASAISGSAGNGGNIVLNTDRLEISDQAAVTTSAFTGSAGNLFIHAPDSVRVQNGFLTGAISSPQASGNGGTWNIETGQFLFQQGSRLSLSMAGRGNGGNLRIRATGAIEIDRSSAVLNQASPGSAGNAGSITLEANRMAIDGSLSLLTDGAGNAGRLSLQADTITVTGGGILTSVAEGASGNGGTMAIDVGQLRLQEGAILTAGTRGSGAGGNIAINASDSVHILGNPDAYSSIGAPTSGLGRGGEITIRTPQLILRDGVIAASTHGSGNAGNINLYPYRPTASLSDRIQLNGISRISTTVLDEDATGNGGNVAIETGRLTIEDGAQIRAGTFGAGQSGTLQIHALDEIRLSEADSGLFTQTDGTGNAQTLFVRAGRLNLQNGAQISSGTTDRGQAGSLILNLTDALTIAGNSQINASTIGQGNAGAIEITAGSLEAAQGGRIRTTTSSSGNAGTITLRIRGDLNLNGSETGILARANANASGQSGSITVTGDRLNLQNQAQIAVNSEGTGRAGDLSIRVNRADLTDRARITAETVSSAGGNIRVQGLTHLTVNNSQIAASTATGQAGRLTVEASESVRLRGSFTQGSFPQAAGLSVQATEDGGTAGDLTVRTDRLMIQNGAGISAATVSGRGGAIRLERVNTVQMNNGQISAATGNGEAGRVMINRNQPPARSIELTDGSELISRATGTGNAGNIYLHTQRLILDDRSEISAATRSGTGGSVRLSGLETLRVQNSQISAATQSGRAGSVIAEVSGLAQLRGRFNGEAAGLSVRAIEGGAAGNLILSAGELRVEDGAALSVSSPSGVAGNLNVLANGIWLDRSELSADIGGANATGATISLQLEPGNLNPGNLNLQNRSRISARASGTANGGNVNINAPSGFILASLPGDNDIVANAFRGRGGNIQISSQGIFGFAERRSTPNNGSNDIDASSEFGTSGTVTLNTPIDPAQGLLQLPENVLDAANQIARTCPSGVTASTAPSRFVATGRGGLPPNPGRSLGSDDVQVEWYSPDRPTDSTLQDAPEPSPENSSNGSSSGSLNSSSSGLLNGSLNSSLNGSSNAPLIEAQGLQIAASGEIQLVAPPQTASLPNPAFAGCTP
ncbi:two-partner secretion domain-containing protein [Leptolyngbya ohadii]|uniref:two-partner secretion domain-containing protein n=1 Tax=Leptolyngbya ohadii TaxID=1962290 RepID=UPI000B59C87B|nr:filamentous hemagglutinin N-terminal domain-containing protein [Leptolyngbya ohadii]